MLSQIQIIFFFFYGTKEVLGITLENDSLNFHCVESKVASKFFKMNTLVFHIKKVLFELGSPWGKCGKWL